jgi:hypothetical protein
LADQQQDGAGSTLTEAAPEYGTVSLLGLPITDAEHWIEDGVHVLRSLDFDVTVGDRDFWAAVDKLGGSVEDLWSYLSELETITDNENETFVLLASRFQRVFRELEKRERERRRRLIILNLRKRGQHHFRNWQPLSTRPPRSSTPSPA